MIEVLSKDYKISGDEGWWTGKCNGKVRAMMALIIDVIKAGNSHGTLSDYFSNYIITIIHSPLAKVGVFPCNFVAPCDLDFSDLPKVVEDSNPTEQGLGREANPGKSWVQIRVVVTNGSGFLTCLDKDFLDSGHILVRKTAVRIVVL